MARMYSRKRGKSGSKKPMKESKPVWIRYSDKEIEILVVKLAKEGKRPSEIGLALRDIYGIPSANDIVGKSITQILGEKHLLGKIPEDLMAVLKKANMLMKHVAANGPDMTAKRGLEITESKIKKLAKYYKRTGKLDVQWKYDPKNLGLYVE
ncbi:30S ribosomal protein S15 [Candidatus Woesearchaeota archaeon]|nr:30S ribosomal protein S15 [Candidatus Woesearchaeota archaeon]